MSEGKKHTNLTGEMNKDTKYQSGSGGVQMPDPVKAAEEFEKLKKKLEPLKKSILSKFKFTRFFGMLPVNASIIFEEDEGLPKEVIESKPLHLIMLIPEDNFKDIATKIKPEVIKLVKESGQNIWIHIKTEVDLWNYGLDSKFEFIDAISACFPLYDNGFLGSLRVANLHKNLVMAWLNSGPQKYVATYAIGGSLVRGTADKTSDVDTFVIIDDTDVKRMSRVELLGKLRGKIYDYIREATALAGVKNILNVQVYLLTDFWQAVKDAQPVMFTFIRDGIPFYDRGTFIPWKRLLQMGKIKPSPEAIDQYMKEGDRTQEIIKRRLIDAMVDIYFGVVTPTQAMFMLAGQAPPVPKTIVQDAKKLFVDEQKVMTLKDIKILESAVKYYKDYEHGKLNEITGKEIDDLLKDCLNYVKRVKEIRIKLEENLHEKTIEQSYDETFKVLEHIFGKKSKDDLIKDLEKNLIKSGKLAPRMLDIAREVLKLKSKTKKNLSQSEVQKMTSDASELISSLIEYSQRKDLVVAEKGLIRLSYGTDKKAEVVLADKNTFLINNEGKIMKLNKDRFEESDRKELEAGLSETKGKLRTTLNSEVMEVLKKHLGEFEIVL